MFAAAAKRIKDRPTEQFSIRLKPTTKNALEAEAERLGVSTNALIGELLDMMLEG